MRRYVRALLAILAPALIALMPAVPRAAANTAVPLDPIPVYNTIVNWRSGLCLGVTNGDMNDGTPVVQYPCNGHPDQKWATKCSYEQGFQFCEIRNYGGYNKCLGVPGGSNDMGPQLVVWTCNGHRDQLWTFKPVVFVSGVPVAYTVQNRNSGQYMGVAGASTGVAAVVQWWGNGSNDQLWLYQP
jgi:hypothetical protein